MPVFALTIFWGAFLLFQVQPLIGKYFFPGCGGPGVWTIARFLPIRASGGLCYAHLLSRRLHPRNQVIVHSAILIAALAGLPITPSDRWKPTGTGNPVIQILVLLLFQPRPALFCFVLHWTAPATMVPSTFSRRNPYRLLYTLSNTGSLLALLSYRF